MGCLKSGGSGGDEEIQWDIWGRDVLGPGVGVQDFWGQVVELGLPPWALGGSWELGRRCLACG